jgi:hypothetical protein
VCFMSVGTQGFFDHLTYPEIVFCLEMVERKWFPSLSAGDTRNFQVLRVLGLI